MTGPSCVAAVALDTERQLHLMRERDDLAVSAAGHRPALDSGMSRPGDRGASARQVGDTGQPAPATGWTSTHAANPLSHAVASLRG